MPAKFVQEAAMFPAVHTQFAEYQRLNVFIRDAETGGKTKSMGVGSKNLRTQRVQGAECQFLSDGVAE